jgi:hypothetical protein
MGGARRSACSACARTPLPFTTKLEAILFEEMRRIDLLWEIVKYTASLL